jgi:tetraacyldisaccharide 4'-kinase
MLSLIGWLYGEVAGLRNKLYDAGLFGSAGLGARTISIGNITAGGTGKTPLVAYVAATLASRNEKVCILTRGYGRKDPGKRVLVSDGEQIYADAGSAGDEPYELALSLTGKAMVIADADRQSAGEWAVRKHKATAFILDDGFQHRRVKRDVDIVCIDATDPFGGGAMLPAGRLREPVDNLRRADVLVITRADQVSDNTALLTQLNELCPDSKIFTARSETVRILRLEDFRAGSRDRSESGERVWKEFKNSLATHQERVATYAFCALGNPENFFTHLRSDFKTGGFDLAGVKTFPDHHRYTQNDINHLLRMAGEAGAKILLTTAKDAVKLSGLEFTLPCYVVEIETVIDDPAAFDELL